MCGFWEKRMFPSLEECSSSFGTAAVSIDVLSQCLVVAQSCCLAPGSFSRGRCWKVKAHDGVLSTEVYEKMLLAGCWKEKSHDDVLFTEVFEKMVSAGCWKEKSHDGVLSIGIVPFVDSVLSVPLALDGAVHRSRSAAASPAAETGGHFPAAAFSRSEDQAPKCPPLSAKKEEKFQFFVKTVEGKTRVFNSNEGDTVLRLLEAVEGAVEDCYVLCNGKILSLNQSLLKAYGRDCTLRSVWSHSEVDTTRKTPSSGYSGTVDV